jgi:hypothetical protein
LQPVEETTIESENLSQPSLWKGRQAIKPLERNVWWPGLPDGFQTKNPNLGKFWRALEWKILVYNMAIWNILGPFVIIYGRLVLFFVHLVYFPNLVCLDQGKSGNPAGCTPAMFFFAVNQWQKSVHDWSLRNHWKLHLAVCPAKKIILLVFLKCIHRRTIYLVFQFQN